MNPTNLLNAKNDLSNLRPVVHRFGWVILALCLLVNFVLPGRVAGDLSLYIVQPAIWVAVASLALWLWSVEGESVKLLEHRGLILSAAMLGGLQVAISILLGFLTGFGHSPYAHTTFKVILNVWFVGTKLVGVETVRWYLGKKVGRINTGLGFIVAWLVPLLLLLPLGKFSLIGQPESAFNLVGGTLLPVAAQNLLAAYLAISAGPLASIAYLGVMQAFEWLSPILPDLPWLGAAFVGVLVPMVGLMALSREETIPAEQDAPQPAKTEKSRENASAGSWLLVAALAVGVIWLNSGALGVRPSLISGNSMNPTLYPGDVVVTRVTAPDQIQVGDVVQFHRDGIDVVHRVMEVQSNGSTPVFITRGDNNNVDDEPVMADQVEGKVILSIPKIGWVGILFRMGLERIGGAP